MPDPSVILEAIKSRRTIRAFRPDPPAESAIEAVLEAACFAPFGGPEPPWRLFRVRSKQKLDQLAAAVRRFCADSGPMEISKEDVFFLTYFERAPVVLAAAWRPTCVVPGFEQKMRTEPLIDRHARAVGIMSLGHALQNLMIAAEAIGLGCGYIGPFHGNLGLEEIIGAESPFVVSHLIPLGYPAETPSTRHPNLEQLINVI
jgi:nitroreductase